MYLPFERNNGEELKNLILYQGFFFQVSSPTFQKRIQSKIPSNKQRNKVSLNIKSWKKKERKKNQCQFKIGHLDKLSFEQFFHEHSLSTLIHFAIGQKRQTTT